MAQVVESAAWPVQRRVQTPVMSLPKSWLTRYEVIIHTTKQLLQLRVVKLGRIFNDLPLHSASNFTDEKTNPPEGEWLGWWPFILNSYFGESKAWPRNFNLIF
jgi:hypothetical protein